MSKTHWAKQCYYIFIPIFPTASLLIEGFRDKNFLTDFVTKRYDKEISPKLLEYVENEMDNFVIKNNESLIKNVEFKVSLSNDVVCKTWGSLLLKNGSEYQFPLTMNTDNHDEMREILINKYSFLNDQPIPYKIINQCLISENGKRFCIQREILKSHSGLYLCFPSFIWLGLSSSFYGGCSFLFPLIGIPLGCILAASGTLFLYPFLFNIYKEQEEVNFDNTIFNEDDMYKQGAKDYFKSCKTICNIVGKENYGIKNSLLLDKRIANLKKLLAESRVQKKKNVIIK
uniref:Conserved domain protein n=1 Tax=Parastrongyloides trichosuri TaxID=131310 RepID=A0A0N4ZVL5_PARTI